MKILLAVYDNGSFIHYFSQGTAYIAAVLRQAGHDVSLWLQDVHHYPDEDLTDVIDRERPDMVGVGVIGGYWQYRKLLSLSRAVEKARHRPFFVLGGHGPSADPAYFMRKSGADAVVMGEGERTIVELVAALESKHSLAGIQGLAWRDGGECRLNAERELIQDLESIPYPAYDMFPIHYYRLVRMPHTANTDFVMPVLSGRGCTFKCTFCYRMDKGYRARSDEAILGEIEYLQKNYGINYIYFSDELLMISKARTIALCEAILRRGLKFKWWCNGRLNYATPKVLELMKRAGCVFVSYGIEAMDDEVLRLMKKGLRVEQVHEGIKATLAAGLSPGFNIIFGNLGDSKETLMRGVDFLLEYDDGAQMRTIRPVTPYPGSPLFFTAIKKGLLKDTEDFYENKHVNSDLLSVNFTDMTDEEFNRALFEANSKLLENYFRKRAESFIEQARNLYMEGDSDFRGFRQT